MFLASSRWAARASRCSHCFRCLPAPKALASLLIASIRRSAAATGLRLIPWICAATVG